MTINWGDGVSSVGTVTKVRAGVFNVSGSHTYSRFGSYRIKISITGKGGSVQTFYSNMSDRIPLWLG